MLNRAEQIVVIKTQLTNRGRGTPEDPCRWVTEYWLPDGTKLFEEDPVRTGCQSCGRGSRLAADTSEDPK